MQKMLAFRKTFFFFLLGQDDLLLCISAICHSCVRGQLCSSGKHGNLYEQKCGYRERHHACYEDMQQQHQRILCRKYQCQSSIYLLYGNEGNQRLFKSPYKGTVRDSLLKRVPRAFSLPWERGWSLLYFGQNRWLSNNTWQSTFYLTWNFCKSTGRKYLLISPRKNKL